MFPCQQGRSCRVGRDYTPSRILLRCKMLPDKADIPSSRPGNYQADTHLDRITTLNIQVNNFQTIFQVEIFIGFLWRRTLMSELTPFAVVFTGSLASLYGFPIYARSAGLGKTSSAPRRVWTGCATDLRVQVMSRSTFNCNGESALHFT